jgi:hypothetical protein
MESRTEYNCNPKVFFGVHDIKLIERMPLAATSRITDNKFLFLILFWFKI